MSRKAPLPRIASPIRSRIVGFDVRPAAELTPNPDNWRLHPALQAAALVGVLEEVGWVQAVVLNTRTGHLVDGHLRVSLAAEAGLDVPVTLVDLSPEEEAKILATLDPLTGMAKADAERLGPLLEKVTTHDDALERVLAVLSRQAPAPGTKREKAPPEELPERAQLGDLWHLGEHRVVCGSSVDGMTAIRALPPDRSRWPALMITDPPYGVDYEPEWREGGKRLGKVLNDTRADWSMAWHYFPGDVVYQWAPSGPDHVHHHAALERAGFEVRMEIIWTKPHFPIGRGHYHVRHEPLLYAVRRGAQARWIGDRKQSTVWEIALDESAPGGHSTQKPLECMLRPMRNHAGDVYDPFLGSGTTLMAAEALGRRCYGLELNPRYVDAILARWERATGSTARVDRG